MTKENKILIFIILVLLLLITINTKTYAASTEVTNSIQIATGVINPNDFEPSSPNGSDINITIEKSNNIISIIQIVGIIVLVISLIILGLKYMIGSIEERAEYKKTMLPYLIGVTIFFSVTQLLAILASLVENL